MNSRHVRLFAIGALAIAVASAAVQFAIVRSFAAAIAGVSLGCSSHQRHPEAPTTPLTDLAMVLSPSVVQKVNTELEEYEQRTKHQVWVWISDKPIPKGQTIEDFGFRTFNAWGVGRAGHDDGVALFIFPRGDRLRMRIQVGFGLEKALPDKECVRILREVIAPPLEAGLYDEGVQKGVKAILEQIEGAK